VAPLGAGAYFSNGGIENAVLSIDKALEIEWI
jgi:hypothetical protein